MKTSYRNSLQRTRQSDLRLCAPPYARPEESPSKKLLSGHGWPHTKVLCLSHSPKRPRRPQVRLWHCCGYQTSIDMKNSYSNSYLSRLLSVLRSCVENSSSLTPCLAWSTLCRLGLSELVPTHLNALSSEARAIFQRSRTSKSTATIFGACLRKIHLCVGTSCEKLSKQRASLFRKGLCGTGLTAIMGSAAVLYCRLQSKDCLLLI